MSDNSLFALVLIVAAITITLAGGIVTYSELQEVKVALAAGLQQCVDAETRQKVWQRECVK